MFHEEVRGGATLAVLRLVPLLEERGWRFAFWVPRPSQLFDYLSGEGHEVFGEPRLIRYSWPSLRHPPGVVRRAASLPGYFARLRYSIRSLSPDLVHANTVLALPEALTARSTGVPTLLHVHEMLPGGVKGAAARRLAHLAADEIVAVSRANAASLAQGSRRPRIVYGASAIAPGPPSRTSRLGGIVVGTVGEITRRKGSDIFVEAARLAARRHRGLEFRMVGRRPTGTEGAWAGALLERAATSGVAHSEWTDVATELGQWDIFVLPSRHDPFPSVVLEAMASGVPVVAAAVDGIPEQVTPETGMLVPPEDPEALADAILELAGDPERRERLAAAGPRRIAGSFTLERQADDLHRAYLAALGG